MLFSELGLGEKLLEAIKNAGYVEPTPIQEQAIPFVLKGRDVLGCAQTGTGKTASFVLPMIEKLASGRARARMPRSLILEPTRELAAQVQDNFEKYGAQHRLSTCLIIGGESMQEQTRKLDRGVDVLIATPGRLIDQFERGNILMTDIRLLVIDECDRMLDMGFIPDIEKIVARLPRTRQTLLFSATLPPEIRRLADKFLTEPQEITVAPPSSTTELVTQALVEVPSAADKRAALRHLLAAEEVRNAFIFCNRKRDIALLEKSLKGYGLNAGALHGDMVQSARQRTLEQFKAGEITLLVCSDVAARGIDVTGVSHVFNFDVPHHAEDYVHRIGRTGRAGASGMAYMLATAEDEKSVAAIVKLIGKPIPSVQLPDLGIDESAGETRPRRSSERRGRLERAPREDRPAEDRPARVRPEEDRPAGDRKRTRRGAQARPSEDRPVEDHPSQDREDRPRGDRPREDRPREERPRAARSDRPSRREEVRPTPVNPMEERGRGDERMENRGHERDDRRPRSSRDDHRDRGSRDRDRPRRPDYDDDAQDAVVGFGDHLPAFLRVAPRLPPSGEQTGGEE